MRLLGWLRVPAAFIAANWAGLVAVMTLVAVVPALAANQRVTGDLDRYGDEAGRTVLRDVRATWWRDLPVSLAFWAYVGAGVATVVILTAADPSTRVLFVGALVPVYWVGAALLGAYVRSAATSEPTASRREVVDELLRLLATHPVRALMTVPVVIATAPIWSLLPFTIACGLSVPAWAVDAVWTCRAPAGDRAVRGGPVRARAI